MTHQPTQIAFFQTVRKFCLQSPYTKIHCLNFQRSEQGKNPTSVLTEMFCGLILFLLGANSTIPVLNERQWYHSSREEFNSSEVGSAINFRSSHTVQPRHTHVKIPKTGIIRRKSLYILTTEKRLWPNIFPIRLYSGYIAGTATISLNNIQVMCSRIKFGLALSFCSSHTGNQWNYIFADISLSRSVWHKLDCCLITPLNFIGEHWNKILGWWPQITRAMIATTVFMTKYWFICLYVEFGSSFSVI